MTREVIATRSAVIVIGWVALLGGGSLLILGELAAAGGYRAYAENYSGRGPPELLVTGAVICLIVVVATLFRMALRRDPPVYLVGDLLHAEGWQTPLDMRLVRRITVRPVVRHSYKVVFELADESQRELANGFYVQSSSGIAAKLGERYGVPVDDCTIEPPPLS